MQGVPPLEGRQGHRLPDEGLLRGDEAGAPDCGLRQNEDIYIYIYIHIHTYIHTNKQSN